MKKCKMCGGACENVGVGKYICECCGRMFSENDFPASGQGSLHAESKRDSDVGAEIFDGSIKGVLELTTKFCCASGYLVTASGYAVTNAHAVLLDNGMICGQCSVRVAGEVAPATVIAVGTNDIVQSRTSDLALLKLARVPSGAKPLKFGNYDSVRTGERVFVIGNSLGYGTCITSGIISDKNRDGLLMYDCPTNPGNSGGPVFNSDGLVIGTHVAGTPTDNGVNAQGMNYAIPCNFVSEFLHKCGIC